MSNPQQEHWTFRTSITMRAPLDSRLIKLLKSTPEKQRGATLVRLAALALDQQLASSGEPVAFRPAVAPAPAVAIPAEPSIALDSVDSTNFFMRALGESKGAVAKP